MVASQTRSPVKEWRHPKSNPAPSPELQIPAGGVIRSFELGDYQKLVEAGFFQPDERVELIHGHLVHISPSNPPHAGTLARLAGIFTFRLWNRVLVRTQSAVLLPGLTSQPEPDLALVRLREDSYDLGHPLPEDIFLVVEISDSTLRYDRSTKRYDYAAAGLPEYWIVNLVDFVLEVYREPFVSTTGRADYRTRSIYSVSQRVAPLAFPRCRINLSAVFPQAN